MRRASIALSILLLAGLSGCIKVSACYDHPEECPLSITVEGGMLQQVTGGDLYVRVDGRSNLAPLTAVLSQGDAGSTPMIPLQPTRQPDSFEISVSAQSIDAFAPDLVKLAITEGERIGETSIPLHSPFFMPPELTGSVQPLIEHLGFSGGKLLSFRSFVLVNAKKRFIRYSASSSGLSEDWMPSGFVLSTELAGTLQTAAFAKDRVVWLDVDTAKNGFAVVNCPITAVNFADCSNPDSGYFTSRRIPLDIKAFAISPLGEIAAFSDVDGRLFFALLPTATASPPPIPWQGLVSQPMPARSAHVLLASADLNGDGTPDLLAVHQDADGQDFSVYNGDVSSGSFIFSFDASTSASWQAALSGQPIFSALALGDLDNDGRADLAAASDSSVSVWLNRNSQPLMLAWTAKPAMDAPVRALAIGQLDGADLNDLVVASSTTNDPQTATQFLSAYLGKTPAPTFAKVR